jgi:hypothetical protein
VKIARYTLNPDGTIPRFVISGGFFPSPNGNDAPQDLTLVGLCTDEVNDGVFASKASLTTYLKGISAGWMVLDGSEPGALAPFEASIESAKVWALKTS